MAQASLACWGCRKEPPDGVKFKRCERCAEAKLPSTYFCSEECMLANWPRHKAWHKHQKEIRSTVMQNSQLQQVDREIAERQARIAEMTGDEYVQLTADAMSRGNEGDLQGAHTEA